MLVVAYLAFGVDIVEFKYKLTVVKLQVGVARLPAYLMRLPLIVRQSCFSLFLCGRIVAQGLSYVVFFVLVSFCVL